MTITQTLAVGNLAKPNIPTNFTNQPTVPPLQLFNPSLGTLQSVQISSNVVYNSSITITNQSQISPATGITAMLSGASFQITGLGPGTVTISGTPMKSATAPDLPVWNGQPGQQPSETVNLSSPRTSRTRSSPLRRAWPSTRHSQARAPSRPS